VSSSCTESRHRRPGRNRARRDRATATSPRTVSVGTRHARGHLAWKAEGKGTACPDPEAGAGEGLENWRPVSMVCSPAPSSLMTGADRVGGDSSDRRCAGLRSRFTLSFDRLLWRLLMYWSGIRGEGLFVRAFADQPREVAGLVLLESPTSRIHG
jgi:hypothetical protein